MKKIYISASLVLMGFLFVSGCGSSSIGGAPGSSGSEDTGILIAVSIVGNPTPTDLTPDIDVALHYCDPPDNTELEDGLFRVTATMTIDAALVNPDFDTFPATVVECNITYYKDEDNLDAPTIKSDTTRLSSCVLNEGTNECNVLLITIARKRSFWSDIVAGIYTPDRPAVYDAFYKCKYINFFGEEGYFEMGYEIFLTDFETC